VTDVQRTERTGRGRTPHLEDDRARRLGFRAAGLRLAAGRLAADGLGGARRAGRGARAAAGFTAATTGGYGGDGDDDEQADDAEAAEAEDFADAALLRRWWRPLWLLRCAPLRLLWRVLLAHDAPLCCGACRANVPVVRDT